MPLYEYECEDCGVRFERRQSITADSLKTCPECGGKGFYVTDNRSKAKSSTAVPKNRDEAKSKTSEKSEKKKETKSKED